jgi:hypothetical protein
VRSSYVRAVCNFSEEPSLVATLVDRLPNSGGASSFIELCSSWHVGLNLLSLAHSCLHSRPAYFEVCSSGPFDEISG